MFESDEIYPTSPHNVTKQLDRDYKKQALFVENLVISFLPLPHLKD